MLNLDFLVSIFCHISVICMLHILFIMKVDFFWTLFCISQVRLDQQVDHQAREDTWDHIKIEYSEKRLLNLLSLQCVYP